MTKAVEFITPPGMPPTAGYAHVAVVRGGRTVYISGQVPMNERGEIVGTTLAEQAVQVFENIGKALAAAGAAFSDLVKISMYVTDMTQLVELRAVRDRYLNTDRPPASTLIEVSGFVRSGIFIEVEAVAVVGDS